MPSYRPQRSWAKVMFLQAFVILSTGGGGSASVHAGMPPPGTRDPTPPDQADPPRGQNQRRLQTDARDPPRPGRPPRDQRPPQDQRLHIPPWTRQTHYPTPHPPHPPGTRDPRLGNRCQHTVNERPVRILLQCILVKLCNFTFN